MLKLKQPFCTTQKITPYDVQTHGNQINYQKLIDQFGCSLISDSLIQKISLKVNQNPHPWLKRKIIFSHRDLDLILNNQFYLYTGRGPSKGDMHLGHLMPFIFTKWLQDSFNVPLMIQLTDDEKYFHKHEDNLESYHRYAMENAKDIIACEFNLDKTFIFINTDYMGYMYKNVCRFQKALTFNQIKGIFGANESNNCGQIAYPAVQAAPTIASSFQHILSNQEDVMCLVPQGIDQDPYFRMTRDVCARLKVPKPACIHSKFFPALQGLGSKMSTSEPNSAIFLTDSQEMIKEKITKYAFSGGGETKKEHKKYGANLDVDIPFQYLTFFMEDDAQLEEIGEKYKKGEMMTSEIKKITIDVLWKIVEKHQRIRRQISDIDVKKYMQIRTIDF